MEENPGPPKIEHSPGSWAGAVLLWVGCGCVAGVLICWLVGFTDGVTPNALYIGSVVGCSGLVSGLFRLSVVAMPSDRRWMLLRPALVGGVICVALCGGLFVLMLTSRHPTQKLPTVGELIGFVLLMLGGGLVLGLGWGAVAVNAWEDREKREFKTRATQAAAKQAARDALEAAIAGKFGPLDEARREAIRGWDDARVADAARRLPAASSLDELA